MLLRFEFANVYSFAAPQVIDLRIGAAVPDTQQHFAPAWPGSDMRVPKVVALFGANASGKSNVLRAASFLAWFVADSFSHQSGQTLPVAAFRGDPASDEVRLAVEFAGPETPADLVSVPVRGCRYRYEFALAAGMDTGVVTTVKREILLFQPAGAIRLRRLFARDAAGRVSAAPEFRLAASHGALQAVLRPDASVLATLAQLNHPLAMLLTGMARNIFRNIHFEMVEPNDTSAAHYLAANSALLDQLNRDLQCADFGIQEVSMQVGPSGPTAVFTHAGLRGSLPPMLESQGTRRFLRLYPWLAEALRTGGVALIDELDQALHPILLAEVLRWFHDPRRNHSNAQLWMTAQNPTLMDELSKEEVYFCEKDSGGRSSVYGLRDMQGVRRDENFSRKYLGGVYGAVPHPG